MSSTREASRKTDADGDGVSIDVKVNRIKIINENLPDLNRWQKRLSETIYPPEVPGSTRSLLPVDRLYIQELPQFIEFDTQFLSGVNKYEIMTRMGKRLFIGCEVPSSKEDMLFQIYDFQGRMIIEFTGRLAGPCKGTAVKVATPFGFLGAVLQGDQMCSPHYSVVNWTGAEVFTIHHPLHFHTHCTCREEPEAMEYFVFTSAIDMATDPTHVGTIARHLPRQLKVKDGAQEDEHNKKGKGKQRDQCCGITFPAELDIQSKILLMATLFVLDYRLIDRRGRRGKKGKGKLSRYFGVHTYAVLISLVLIGGLVLIFYIFGTTHPHDHKDDATPKPK